MSRRHGRAHHHERPRREGPKPGTPPGSGAVRAAEAAPPQATSHAAKNDAPPAAQGGFKMAPAALPPAERPETPVIGASIDSAPAEAPRIDATRPVPRTDGAPNAAAFPHANGMERGSACTAPQLRRFIKSRPYVPMHELRRRFAIDGEDDDVSPVEMAPGRIFVGLPAREGQLLGELLRAGEIGYELSLDPRTPIVVGVYPMRPVPRP
jgi:hypothetical protein